MKLSDLFTEESIVLDIPAEEKDKLLENIIKTLDSNGLIKDFANALRDVMEREKVMSTGIGHGVEFPARRSSTVVRWQALSRTATESHRRASAEYLIYEPGHVPSPEIRGPGRDPRRAAPAPG